MKVSIPTGLFVNKPPFITRNSLAPCADTRKESPSDKHDIGLAFDQEPRLRGRNGDRPEPTYEKQNLQLIRI
jgi:hypothetical protein